MIGWLAGFAVKHLWRGLGVARVAGFIFNLLRGRSGSSGVASTEAEAAEKLAEAAEVEAKVAAEEVHAAGKPEG